MGETRVDLLHLLEDLRDAYTGSLEETILTEIVANSLDSGASRIELRLNSQERTIAIIDDGSGMKRAELRRYHDIAASSKTRGEGIGFAGVGIKLALLICEEVHTEAGRGKTHVATRWHLANRHRAPWKWVVPEGLVGERGTAVRLRLTNPLSPLLDSGFLETTLRRHYAPLLDSSFEQILHEQYPQGVRFVVDGRDLSASQEAASDRAALEIRIGRKRKPSALGYLVRDPVLLADAERGLAISTLGKVIRRGWDWVGVTAATPESVGGLIEAPMLAECLTLNKSDFIRSGTRGATYLSLRKAIQEAVAHQLSQWGETQGGTAEAHRRVTRPVERDLERVLVDLADDFPLLGSLVERRLGGQRRLPMGRAAENGRSLVIDSIAAVYESAVSAADPNAADRRGEQSSTAVEEPPEPQAASSSAAQLPGSPESSRPARYGITIQLETRRGDPELARLVESTVWVNDAHPAYRRAVASRSEGYHLALSVAMAMAPLAAESTRQHGFVTAFLTRWGESLAEGRRRG